MCKMLEKIKNLPLNAGCYLFKNKNGTIIYVGKAKNLKKRVQSYFIKGHNQKTTLLIQETKDFFYIITNTEQEALILEANLIKKHTPKYNFKLLDDKTYPYLEITQEKHPQLKISRFKKIPPGKILFGPYPSLKSTKITLKLLHLFYPLKRCPASTKKACFYFYINQCLGACSGKIVDYEPNIKAITNFLKGDTNFILTKIKTLMQTASQQLFYEKAQEYRDMITHIKNTTKKQIINHQKSTNYDILAYAFNQDQIAIQILQMQQGNITDSYHSVFSYVGYPQEHIHTYLAFYYQNKPKPEFIITGKNNQNQNFANELQQQKEAILFNVKLLEKTLKTKIIVAQKGDKQKLYFLALKNAQNNLSQNNLIYQSQEQLTQQALDKLAVIFNRDIKRIDVFDNSQLFGQAFVSSRIVFDNFHLEKKLYRTYHIKNNNPNEYQAFEEVLTRSYNKQEAKPDLILVDGGFLQLQTSFKALHKLNIDIALAALQKNKKHQLEYLITSHDKIALVKKPQLFRFLKQLSEEVHRFTVKFHRKTKHKLDYQTTLSQIKGIGLKRKKAILTHFTNLAELKKASWQDLKKIGISKKIFEAIKNNL
ncbi:excinuclease ABC subunit UvrC [Candidatus Phytoplasma solani]|uniref:UvrABC system protein C n=1 Tax=Candidatus Phytoplasma solani TaxID=69896 RepID=A0A421NV09_9MOLU|nr:excinuclease ABC subunit UvrC [Candidatus Phytoplasma solani]RMI87866.1 excinuclease ABC subunit C [Candidatus Phytoplasma solani]CCP88311.1 Excinuclease ABC subunit C [Candidatus Phytoplasma solani]